MLGFVDGGLWLSGPAALLVGVAALVLVIWANAGLDPRPFIATLRATPRRATAVTLPLRPSSRGVARPRSRRARSAAA